MRKQSLAIITSLSLSVILAFLSLSFPAPVHAQVCTPACPSGKVCMFVQGSSGPVGCGDPCILSPNGCQVSEITVTAKKTTASGSSFAGIVNNIVSFVNGYVIPLVYALAFLFLFIGIVRFFFIEGGEEGIEKGKKMVLYGLIGLVIMFTVWGLVQLLINVLTATTGS